MRLILQMAPMQNSKRFTDKWHHKHIFIQFEDIQNLSFTLKYWEEWRRQLIKKPSESEKFKPRILL